MLGFQKLQEVEINGPEAWGGSGADGRGQTGQGKPGCRGPCYVTEVEEGCLGNVLDMGQQ